MQTELHINVSYSLILMTLPNDSCLDVWSGFRYYFILFLHLVTFAHVFCCVFKAGVLAEIEYKQIIYEDDLPVLFWKRKTAKTHNQLQKFAQII